jgi:hypothetical protein
VHGGLSQIWKIPKREHSPAASRCPPAPHLIFELPWHTLKPLAMAKKPHNRPALSPAVKPMAKAILKAGLNLYDAAEEHVAEAREQLRDLIAEVRDEMNGRLKRKPAPKNTSSSRRRQKT